MKALQTISIALEVEFIEQWGVDEFGTIEMLCVDRRGRLLVVFEYVTGIGKWYVNNEIMEDC